MKHLLLIILSFLLLSSPLIGDNPTLPVSGGKGVTLYEWTTSGFGDPNTGGTVLTKKGLSVIPSTKVWKYFGDRKTQPVYKGEVENGVPNGLGFIIYPKRRYRGEEWYEIYQYVGSWKNGRYNGYGIERHYDGSREVGEWENGKEWNITYYYPNGYIFGKFVNGEWISQ